MSNPYRTFTPFITTRAFIDHVASHEVGGDNDDQGLYEHLVEDPTGSQWRRIGLDEIDGPKTGVIDPLDGAGHLLHVGFAERVLPGKVLRQAMDEKIAEIEARDGRKMNKKMKAELRDEVELELLPKAFIRRSRIPVMLIYPNLMLIFSGSAKKCDEILSILLAIFGSSQYTVHRLLTRTSPVVQITNWAMEPEDLETGDRFEAGDAAVFTGTGKRTIRVKDREIYGHEVQHLLQQEYRASALALEYIESGDDMPSCYFTVTENLIFKGFSISDVVVKDAAGEDSALDIHGTSYLVAKTYKKVIDAVIDAMGGLDNSEPEGDNSTDDDDEL